MEQLLASWRPRVRLRVVDGDDGPVLRTFLEVGPESGDMGVVRGEKGDKGNQGMVSRPWTVKAVINDGDSLPTLGLADRGSAYVRLPSGNVDFWTGSRWITGPGVVSRQGDAGPAVRIAPGVVTAGAPGSDASADLSGTAPDKALSLTMPRGATGPQGPQGGVSVSGSADVDQLIPPVDGSPLVWSSEDGLWQPQSLAASGGVWSLSASDFDTSSTDGSSKDVAFLTIPPQSVDVRLMISGMLRIYYPDRRRVYLFNSFPARRFFVDVFAGSDRVGRGTSASAASHTLVRTTRVKTWSQQKLTPGDPSGVFPAGTPIPLRVEVVRESGDKEWNVVDSSMNSIIVRAVRA